MAPSPAPRNRLITVLVIAAAACLVTLSTHGQVIDYGFNYDDYHQVRPYTIEEVVRTFSGPWDPLGIEVPFYRPLTIAFYALRFELLGIDARLHHALSLDLFALAAAMVGVLLLRVGAHPWLAVLGTLVFAVHPSMPYPLAVWATSQMHLLQTLLVLAGLLWWTVCRDRSVVWWLPFLLLQVVVFLIKEDGLMLLPCIGAVHACYRWLVDRATPPLPRLVVWMAAALMVTLLVVRHLALGGPGGYGIPGWHRALAHWSYGLIGVFLQTPIKRPWQMLASPFMLIAIQAGVVTAAVLPRLTTERFVVALGLCLALVFNMPFVMMSKPLQWHLIATGHAMVLAAALGAVIRALPARWPRIMGGAVVGAGILAMALVARHTASDFAPRSAMTLYQDEIVLGWSAVPYEIREFLARKPVDPAAAMDAVDIVAFGAYDWETGADGRRFRWTSAHTTLMVDGRARTVNVPVRATRESALRDAGVLVRLEGGGRLLGSLRVQHDRWTEVRVRVPPRRWWSLGSRHRIDLRVEPSFVPANENPLSDDRRTLGVSMGEISLER